MILSPRDSSNNTTYIEDLDASVSETLIPETNDEVNNETNVTLTTTSTEENTTTTIITTETMIETSPTTILTETSTESAETNLIQHQVPTNINTSFKSYMDYRCITDTSSSQYRLQQQAYTDSKGLRKIGDDYCVALGTYYTSSCNERFEITLNNGYSFTAIVSDIKDNAHTDTTNRYNPSNGNVVEFIVDTDVLSKEVIYHGSVGHYEEFNGEIVAINKLV